MTLDEEELLLLLCASTPATSDRPRVKALTMKVVEGMIVVLVCYRRRGSESREKCVPLVVRPRRVRKVE